MPDFLYQIPLPVAGALIIGCLCLYAVAGLLLVRRVVIPRMRVTGDDSDFTGSMMQAILVFYGLAVALVAVSVWENHSDVSTSVSHEASRLACVYRDVSGYPEPVRTTLRDELRGYTDYVIREAWPAQRNGVFATRGVEWMNRFQSTLCTFEPRSEGEKLLHGEALAAYNHLIEARRLRLEAVLGRLPMPLWFVIHAGALISLASAFFFIVPDVRLHILQVTLLAVFVGLVIMLILAFDRPFVGDLGIGPEAFELVRGQLMTP